MPHARPAPRRALPHDLANEPPPCEQAAAIREQTQELARWREHLFGEKGVWAADVTPAMATFSGFGARLDALCRWLKGAWPWLIFVAFLIIERTVNAAPDEVPKLLEGVGALVRGIAGL